MKLCIAVTVAIAWMCCAAPLHAQTTPASDPLSLFFRTGIGRVGSAPGITINVGIHKGRFDVYAFNSESWYDAASSGGNAEIREGLTGGGVAFHFLKVRGFDLSSYLENGEHRTKISWADGMGDSYKSQNTGFHSTFGFGFEHRVSRNLLAGFKFGKMIVTDPKTRGLWDLQLVAGVQFDPIHAGKGFKRLF